MGKQGRPGYHPQMQPQAIMHPHMGAPLSPTGMPGMIPGSPQPGMQQGMQLARTSLGLPQTSKSGSKGSSDKSSGSGGNKEGKAKQKGTVAIARKGSAPTGKYPPANLPRPQPQSRPNGKRTGPHSHLQGMQVSPGADAVAHVHVDSTGAPLSKGSGAARPPSSYGTIRR